MPVFSQISMDGKTKQVGYGLPCANCRAYYGADLTSCPICGSAERVPANGTDLDRLCVQSPRVLSSSKFNEAMPPNCTERLQ